MECSVLSYNIRRYGDEALSEHLWENRKGAVRALISRHVPVIFCLQEDHPRQTDFIREAFPGHKQIGFYTEDIASPMHGEQNSIFFDTTQFTLLDHGHFWLTDTPNKPSTLPNQSTHHRTCVYVQLRARNGVVFFVFNTHFDHLLSDVRREEFRILHARIMEIKGSHPYIICGDFNEDMESPLLVAFSSHFPRVNPVSHTSTYCGWIGVGESRCLDYQFSSFPVARAQIDTTAYTAPNGVTTTLSDHYPLITVFLLSTD